MKPPKKDKKREEDFSQMSMAQRAGISEKRIKKSIRAKLIIANSALALLIILVVLVCKVVSLNHENTVQKKEKEVALEKKEKDAKATPVPTIVPTVVPIESDQWLRKDLDPNKPMVALTFDDGPYTPVTGKILDVLEKYNAKATFFCVGSRVPKYSDMVTRAYNLGCEIASHTYSHVYLTKLKAKKIKSEQNKVNKVISDIIGCEPTALRPPGGFVNAKVRKNMKVPMICWSIDSEDWKTRNVKKIIKECKSIVDGDIVLMHDLYPTTAKAIEKVVPRLIKDGYQLVTVDEMFYYKGIPIEAGEVHFSGK